MKKKELYEMNKSELIEKVETLQQATVITQEENGYRLYLGSSESSRRLKKRINFKFAIQSLISIALLGGSVWMVAQDKLPLVLPGIFLFIFGLVYYNTIMKNHMINTLGACELVIKKEK